MSPGIPTRLLATQSDERLVALVRQGHERAFEALVHRYRRPLLRYCRRLSLPEARAEDVLQQALLKTWVALRGATEVHDIRAWLYRVVHNGAVNALRDGAQDRDRLADPSDRVGASEPDVDRSLVVRETLAEVAALPPLQREVIVRTAVVGHSHEEVASALGITHGAVRGLLYRARATLRTAATALTPPPVLNWIAGGASQGAPAPERLSELAAGGTAGLGGLLVKGTVAAVTAGTLITASVVHTPRLTHRDPRKVASVIGPPVHTTVGRPAPTDPSLRATDPSVSHLRATAVSGVSPSRRTPHGRARARWGGPVATIHRHGVGTAVGVFPKVSRPVVTPTGDGSPTATPHAHGRAHRGSSGTGDSGQYASPQGSGQTDGGQDGSGTPPTGVVGSAAGKGEGGGSGKDGSQGQGSGGSGSLSGGDGSDPGSGGSGQSGDGGRSGSSSEAGGSGQSGGGDGGDGSADSSSGAPVPLVGDVVREAGGLVGGVVRGVLH